MIELREARNDDERCDVRAPEGSRAWGNRCVLIRGHGGAHLWGAARYETETLEDDGGK